MSTNQLKLASRVMFSDRLYFISLTYVREVVLESGTREPVTRTGIVCFVKNRNRKFENSPYPEPNRNWLNTRRVPEGS